MAVCGGSGGLDVADPGSGHTSPTEALGRSSGAARAALGSVGLHAGESRSLTSTRKTIRHILPGTEVDLIRCLTLERGMGDARVVLGDVERHELVDGPDRVELVHEEPLVLELSPTLR